MKVKKIAKQLEEYERLGRLIRDLDLALKNFDKIEELPIPTVVSTTFIGHVMIDQEQAQTKCIDIHLNSNITELVRDEVKEILLRHRVELKKKQDKLEVI